MVYQNDTHELRDAREKVYQDQIEAEIAAKQEQIDQKEKEIKLIEKEIELLEKQQDAIQKQIDATNEYYDKLIEALEEYKDKWQELAELEEQAKLMATLEELGYSVDDILNMSEDAFQSFKMEYLGLLKDCHSGNELFYDSLSRIAGVDMRDVTGYLERTAGAISNIDSGNLAGVTQDLKDMNQALGGGTSGGGTAGGGTSGGGGVSTGVVGSAEDAKRAIDDLGNSSKSLNNLKLACEGISKLFEGENSFVAQLKSLGDGSLNFDALVEKLTALKEAVNAVTSAIGGGGGESGENLTDKGFPDSKEGSETGEGDNLLSSIKEVNDADLSTITSAFAGGEEKDAPSLMSAVNKVTDAIGTADGKNKEALVPTIINLPKEAQTPLNETKNYFDELKESIDACVNSVQNLVNQIKSLPGGGGIFGKLFGGGGLYGTAYARGNWSAKSKGLSGNALTGEEGYEILVDSKTGTWRTIGDRGAEFVNVKPSDLIFNHKQSEELLKNGKTKGRAYADGKLPNGFKSLTDAEESKFNILSGVKNIEEKLASGNHILDSLDKNVEKITNNSTVNNNPTINVNNPTFTCTGVTGEEVLKQIEGSFTGLFSRAYQQSMAQ